jgi:hypothetical protein
MHVVPPVDVDVVMPVPVVVVVIAPPHEPWHI